MYEAIKHFDSHPLGSDQCALSHNIPYGAQGEVHDYLSSFTRGD